MITDVTAVFPNNVVLLTQDRLSTVDPEMQVFRRPLKPTDPVQCMGIWGALWTPREDSYEFRGQDKAREPTLQNYNITIQGLNKDMDSERGLAVMSVLAKMIRGVLYHDAPLRVGLQALTASMYGSTERLKRWEIRSQRYLSNEVSGEWVYLSTTDFRIETETV